ncbi:hypothetical protein AX16_001238 [Volvariella volvacea WC 439]|nr:hypothetical protein AX16_001238 [Volvariella volvacea WC 439]
MLPSPHMMKDLATDVLLNLARLCRLLNTISILHYLQRSGIYSQTTNAITLEISLPQEYNPHLLQALRIALFLCHINTLTCYISRPPYRYGDLNPEWIPRQLVQILNALCDLVERLDSIDHIKLNISGFCALDFDRMPSHQGEVGQVLEAREWARSYGQLMYVSTKKATKVELGHGTPPFHFYRHGYMSLYTTLEMLWNTFWTRTPDVDIYFRIMGMFGVHEWIDEWGQSLTKEECRAISPTIDGHLKVEVLTLKQEVILPPLPQLAP